MKSIRFTLWVHIALCLLIFCAFNANAQGALIGGNLTYTCLGNNTYRFTFTRYRNCTAVTPPTTQILSINGCGNVSGTVTLTQVSAPTELPFACATTPTKCAGGIVDGATAYTYSGFYTFPSVCNAWKVSMTMPYARNSAIPAFSNPATDNFYIEMAIDNSVCNSSPVFTQTPYLFACTGFPFVHNSGVTDLEGDSLAFSLVAPMTGPTSTVTYQTDHSVTKPLLLGQGSVMDFNTQTGQIGLTPTTYGDGTTLTLLVKEYRNGVFVGSVMRDMELWVLNCNNAPPKMDTLSNITGATFIPATNSGEFSVGVGQTMSFSLNANDPNAPQLLTLFSNASIACPNASVNITTGTGNAKIFNFAWTPTSDYVGRHILSIEAKDNNCDFLGYTVKGFLITVAGVKGSADRRTMCVGTPTTVALSAQATVAGGIYQWSAVPSIGTIPSGRNVAVSVKKATVFTITHTLNNIVSTDTVMVQGYGGVEATPAVVSNYLITDPPIQLTATYPNPAAPSVVCGSGNTANCIGAQANRTIGSGTGTTGTTGIFGGIGTPYQGLSHDGRIQMLYTAAELTAAGVQAGLITSLQFNISQKNSTAPYLGFTIKMGCSSLTALTVATGFETGLTTVYTNASLATVAGMNTHTFQTPYQWNGTSSLIVEVCFDNAASTSYDHITVTPTIQNTVLYKRQNSTIGCTLAAPAASTARANIVLRNCPVAPTNTPIYTWTVAPATYGALSDTTIANPTATANTSALGATVRYIVSASDGRCTSKDTVVVGVINNTVTCNASLAINASSTELNCYTTNATLAATAISGTQPFTYAWSNGVTSTNNMVTNAGIYTVTLTDALACTATASVAVTQNTTTPTVSIVGNTVFCSGQQSYLTATGGNLYTWNTNETMALISVFTGGIYTVTATNGMNGCTASSSITVIENQLPPMPTIQGTTIICSGSIATVCVANTGLMAYEWSNGANTQCTQFTTSGLYTVTIVDANGCTSSTRVGITVRVAPVFSLIGTTTFCAGSSTTICASNGFTTYTWSHGSTQRCPVINTAGVYTITISDVYGCTATNSVTIVKDSIAPPTVTPNNPIINCNSSITLTASGSGSYFRWFNTPSGGNSLTGFATFTTPVLTANTTYFVEQISNGGCPSERTAVPITVAGPNCATTISGYVLQDNNMNCMRDTGDTGIASYANLKLRNVQTNAIRYFSTDANGFYQTTTDTGRYVLSLSNPLTMCNDSLVCPSQNYINIHAANLFGVYPNNNFYYQYDGLPQTDFSCSVYAETARPVLPRKFWLYYYNNSNLAVPNVNLTFTKATAWTNLIMQGTSPLFDTQTGDTYTWNIPTIPPNSSGSIHFTMELPSDARMN